VLVRAGGKAWVKGLAVAVVRAALGWARGRGAPARVMQTHATMITE
jgi:hypothetical protein